MEHRLITLIPSILAVVSLAACESVEPPQTFDVDLIVECSNCNSHPDRTNLRVFLRPADALIGDVIRSDIFVGWNEWLFVGTGTDTVTQAFEDIEAGDYLITAAQPVPCRVGRRVPRSRGRHSDMGLHPGHRAEHGARCRRGVGSRHPAGMLRNAGAGSPSASVTWTSGCLDRRGRRWRVLARHDVGDNPRLAGRCGLLGWPCRPCGRGRFSPGAPARVALFRSTRPIPVYAKDHLEGHDVLDAVCRIRFPDSDASGQHGRLRSGRAGQETVSSLGGGWVPSPHRARAR